MHEVLGKAITCQTSSIIFSLTRLFFFRWRPWSRSSWSFCALAVFFFFSGSHAVLASELLVRQSCSIKRPLPFPGLPLHSQRARKLWEPGCHFGLRSKHECTCKWFHFDVTSVLSASRMWKEASSSLVSARRWAAFIYCIKFRYNWCSVLCFFSPSHPSFGLIVRQVSSAWPYS